MWRGTRSGCAGGGGGPAVTREECAGGRGCGCGVGVEAGLLSRALGLSTGGTCWLACLAQHSTHGQPGRVGAVREKHSSEYVARDSSILPKTGLWSASSLCEKGSNGLPARGPHTLAFEMTSRSARVAMEETTLAGAWYSTRFSAQSPAQQRENVCVCVSVG